MTHFYLRFFNLLHALNEEILEDKNNNRLRLLMKICSEAYIKNNLLTVNQVLAWTDHGSQSTLHKRLHELVELGQVTLEYHQSDARVKWVQPTKKALALFDKLDQLMIQTVASGPVI